ncbi:hypothetical protein Tco_0688515 [Tanacetum coccineum]
MNSSTMVWVVETDYASPSRMDVAGSINASIVESSQHKQSITSPLVNDCLSPKEDLVIDIPRGKDKGHSLATIRIEYEWKPPRRRKESKNKHQSSGQGKHGVLFVGDGVVLNKPSSLHFVGVEKGDHLEKCSL